MTVPVIVAELSASHLQDLDRTKRLIDCAATAGADAVKLQTFKPEQMAAAHVVLPAGPWQTRDMRDLYAEAMLPWEWHAELFEYAGSKGLIGFSSPFSVEAVDFLETLDCPMYKIASPEIVHHELIQAVAATGKPLIISTGMATRQEIIDALLIAEMAGAHDTTLLHCVSAYPASTASFNLNTMVDMQRRFGLKTGLSSHAFSSTPAVVATVLGAILIEMHLTLSRADGGPDAGFALEPSEFSAMVEDCREARLAMGEVYYGPVPEEVTSLQYRRSLWIVKTIQPGETLTREHLALLRPASGEPPSTINRLIGRVALRLIPAGTPLKAGDFH